MVESAVTGAYAKAVTPPADAGTCAAADPPVVLHLLPNLHTGGAETMLLHVQERVMRRGRYAPLICGLKGAGSLRDAFDASGLPVVVLGIPRRTIYNPPAFAYDVARSVLAVRRLIRTHHVRLLQSHLPDADLLAIVVGRLTGVPTVVTQQSSNLTPVRRKPGLRLRLRRWLVRRCYRYADAMIAVSPAVTDTLTAEADVPPAKINLIFNAVDVPGRPGRATHAAARAALGAAGEECVVLCTARLVENKGHADLIAALRRLPATVGPVHLVLVGDGPERAALEAHARRVPAPHRVTFLGLRSDAVDLLAGADVFCLPSWWEGLSMALLEALARELPVVATRVPGIQDTVTDGVHALLVPPRDPAALADAITRVYHDRALAARLAADGCTLVAERYNLDLAAERTEALYERLLTGGPPR